jgi:hypothetical protein
VVKRITEDEFRNIKRQIEEAGPDFDAYSVGYKAGRGPAKISIIAACKTFEEYKRISKAEHPPVKNSLADRVTELERRVDALESTQTTLFPVEERWA